MGWSIVPAGGGPAGGGPAGGGPAVGSMALKSAAGTESGVFEMPVSGGPMKLLLTYSRSIATTRIEGVLTVERVGLELL